MAFTTIYIYQQATFTQTLCTFGQYSKCTSNVYGIVIINKKSASLEFILNTEHRNTKERERQTETGK